MARAYSLAPVIVCCLLIHMMWFALLSVLFGRREFPPTLTTWDGFGALLMGVPSAACCGYFAAACVETPVAKRRTFWSVALTLSAFNLLHVAVMRDDICFPGNLARYPWDALSYVWPVPWVALGWRAEAWTHARGTAAGRKSWDYVTRDGRTFPARSPHTHPALAAALGLAAVALWASAAGAFWTWYVVTDATSLIHRSGLRADDLPDDTPYLLATFCLAGLGWFAWQLGARWRAPSAERHLRAGARPPILYLRSFKDDGTRTRVGLFDPILDAPRVLLRGTLERHLAKRLRRIGTMVAVGRPGEDLPPVGAARMYLRDEDWQAVVADLMDRSRLVVLHAGPTPGLRWEMDRVRQTVRPEWVIILIPFGRRKRGRGRERVYAALRSEVETGLRCRLPDKIGASSLIYFDPDGEWLGKVLRRPKDVDRAHPLRPTLVRLARDSYVRGG